MPVLLDTPETQNPESCGALKALEIAYSALGRHGRFKGSIRDLGSSPVKVAPKAWGQAPGNYHWVLRNQIRRASPFFRFGNPSEPGPLPTTSLSPGFR